MKAQPQGWRCKAALLFAVVLCSLHMPNASAMGNPNERYLFDISPGIAAWRLNDFGSQSGMQLLFNFEDMKGVNVAAVHGEFKPFEALDKMIAGTDIRYEFVNRRTVTLTRAPPTMRPSKAAREKADASVHGTGDRRSSGAALEEVTISGTQPSSLATVGSPLLSITRTDIDATGMATVPGVIRTLPQVFGGGPTEDTVLDSEARTNVGRGTGVNLRGLGASSTLVLMNGRRLPGAGSEGQYVDVSNLPLSAVERIDILPDSSSTLYGSDAVGGVANFVMRDRFEGRQTEAYFGDTTRSGHLNETYISQLVGGHTGSGHGLFAFDFYSRDNLEAASRDMAKSDLREYGGSDFDVQQSNPGNIVLGSTVWAIPSGQDGTSLKPGDFVKDSPNLQDRYKGGDILPTQRRWTGFGTWRQDVTDRFALFADVLVGQRDATLAGTAASAQLTVPVTNAFYASPIPLLPRVPLPIRYSFYDDLGAQVGSVRLRDLDVNGGFEQRFGHNWNATATLSYSRENTSTVVTNGVNPVALNAALASSDRSVAFNPFGDGSHTNPATLDSIRASTFSDYESTVASANAILSGPLLRLPAGTLDLSFGSEAREQRFGMTLRSDTTAVPTDTQADRERHVYAGFAELRIPLIGESNRARGVEALALSLAERYEHYDDFGSALTPRLGFSWAPFRGVTLQGSYSASFRPPGLLDLDESNNSWGIISLRDPQTGLPANVLIWGGKNRDLRKETAHSWTAGLQFEPEAHPNTALALTYFDTDFTDRITRINPTLDLLSNPLFSAVLTRSPSAQYRSDVCSRASQSGSPTLNCLTTPIVAIADVRVRNDAIVETRGIDMLARYDMSSHLGRFSFSLNGTYILSFAESVAVDQPLVEFVNTQSHPVDLKLRGSTRWQFGQVDLSAYLNYMSGYKDIGSNPQRRVDSWTTVDLHATYALGTASDWLGRTTVALSADNLFDTNPPFLNNSLAGLGYDQENGDLIGRMLSLSVRTRW
jgi:iron complex outermembrane recepter protein